MKNIIKNLAWVVSSLVVAGVFFIAPVKAQASVNLDSLSNEGWKQTRIGNATTNSGWADNSITASPGDTVSVRIHYHNFTSTEVASNVQMSITAPTGSATSQTFTGRLWASNSASTYTDPVTVNISSAQTLTLVSGSVKWYAGSAGTLTTLPSGQSGDSITSSGVNIGNVNYGDGNSGFIVARFLISNNNPGSAPSVSTNSATSISQTSATLNGSVNPNGASTNAWFEYGTTYSLGSQTSSQSVGSGTSNTSTNYSVSGLSNNTTYYFRAVAQNNYGTAYGSILSFTTTGNVGSAPSVSTNSATSISQTSATLNGSVNPNGASTNAWFEYGTTYSLGSQTSSQSVGSGTSNTSTNYSVSGLSNNTTYYFRAVAQNNYGTAYGSILSFTTTGNSGGCSPIVTSNSASFITENSTSLLGYINPNGYTTEAWFEYGTNSSLGTRTSYQTFYSYSSQDLIRYVSSLTPNTTYYYRAAAQNSCGTVYGSTLSFTTTGSTNLSTVNTLLATNVGLSYATLNGSVNPGNSDATSWFEYGTDSYLSTYSITSSANTGSGNYLRSISAPVSGLASNVNYYFRAVARNNMGTVKGSILSFRTDGYTPGPTPTYGSLSITKEVKNLTFPNGTLYVNASSIGDVIEYTLNVKNVGSGTINNVTVKDTISSYYDIVESNPSYVSGGAGGELTWNLGSISSNENRVIYLRVKARTTEQSVVIYNSFTASATGATTRTSNKTTTILNPSMMAMDISADKGVVDRNGTFTYNIRYRNIGINDVDNVVIKVSLPEAINFVSSTPTQSSSDANVYFYRIGRVSRNQVGTISIQAKVNEDAEIGTRQIATSVMDYNDIFGTPQRNISVSSAVDVGTGLASALAAGVGFSFGGNWWVYLLWFFIILLILAIVYLYFRISQLLKNNY